MPKGDFGWNGSISTRGQGARKIRCVNLQFGLEIIASADSEARSRRAFYPVVTDGSQFTMVIAFRSYEERALFSKWMSGFMTSVSEGSAKYGAMTVRVPSRKFTRIGVPQGSLEYGEGVGDLVYEVTISFLGAVDPVDLSVSQRMAGVSYFVGAKKDQTSRYFYPSGVQVKGSASLDGALFDDKISGADFIVTPEEASNPTAFKPRPGATDRE